MESQNRSQPERVARRQDGELQILEGECHAARQGEHRFTFRLSQSMLD
jgi:hypothetical protein